MPGRWRWILLAASIWRQLAGQAGVREKRQRRGWQAQAKRHVAMSSSHTKPSARRAQSAIGNWRKWPSKVGSSCERRIIAKINDLHIYAKKCLNEIASAHLKQNSGLQRMSKTWCYERLWLSFTKRPEAGRLEPGLFSRRRGEAASSDEIPWRSSARGSSPEIRRGAYGRRMTCRESTIRNYQAYSKLHLAWCWKSSRQKKAILKSWKLGGSYGGRGPRRSDIVEAVLVVSSIANKVHLEKEKRN